MLCGDPMALATAYRTRERAGGRARHDAISRCTPTIPIMRDEQYVPKIVPGRSCGDCSMCCKIMRVDELDKPQGVWCRHCAPGKGGCTIHETRPFVCRDYRCGWLISSDIGPEWQPSICKMVINFEKDMIRISVHVDPGHPAAWRREPYYSQFKQWSRRFTAQKKMLVVFVKRRAIVILPDSDVDLGELGPVDDIRVMSQMTPQGRTWSAVKTPAKEIQVSS
jgi:hypothetical protein